MICNFRSIAFRLAMLVPLIGALFLLYPEPSYACKCAVAGSPSEELAKSGMVFQGQVVSIIELEAGVGTPTSAGRLSIEFDVETVWKGSVAQSMNLMTNRDTASCGVSFEEGATYVIYSEGDSSVHRCSRTRSLSEATQDLAELGQGQAPTQNTTASIPEQPAGNGCGLSPLTADLSVVGLMFVAVVLGLPRRHSDRT